MPRPKSRDPLPRPSPAKFLRDLGIRRRNPADVFTKTYWQAVRRAGGDPDKIDLHGGYSVQAGDVYFITERIAKQTLSTEYDFFLRTLGYLRRLGDTLPSPQRIADVGGGTGLVSMYLAASHPDSDVTVFDHSPAQLAVGRAWTNSQHLNNVGYEQATYQQLATRFGPKDRDLVLFFRGMNM